MIDLQGLHVRAGEFTLRNVQFTVPTGEYAALMGKTGSGKTTLLEAVAGLKHVSAGTILLDGVDVTKRKPADRNLGYVPQDGALFPTMTVRDQLAFALTIRRQLPKMIETRVRELAHLLEIGHLLGRTTVGLSGGERQRVALGRALSFRPRTLLLDEPLSALDDETRGQMYRLLAEVRDQTGVTVLHVTHSLDEARHLADVIFRIEGESVTRLDTANAAAPQKDGLLT